jgi:hypothetical protein
LLDRGCQLGPELTLAEEQADLSAGGECRQSSYTPSMSVAYLSTMCALELVR